MLEQFYLIAKKLFKCINHELLIAKLNSYGVDKAYLDFLCSYLTKGKQRTAINLLYKQFEKIIFVVPQVSSLGRLFLIYAHDIDRYTDNNTCFTCSYGRNEALSKLKVRENIMNKKFQNDYVSKIEA